MSSTSDLTNFVRQLEELAARCSTPDQFGNTSLSASDAADVKRIALEAKSIVDGELGVLNDFSAPLMAHSLHMSNIAALQEVRDVQKTIEGAMNAMQRHSGTSPNVDALTGLLQKSAFDMDLSRDVDTARTQSAPLSLVFVDVDRFKKVNDEHGHPKGDQVLAEVASRLKAVCSGRGRAYRIGGEEIVLTLPNHDLSEALATAERCRVALESSACAGLQITASFGVSSFPKLANSAEQLVSTADTAMYDAKKKYGRNLVRFFGEPPPEVPKPPTLTRKAPEPGGLTDEQLIEMRARYFRTGVATCPNDKALLQTNEFRPINGMPVVVFDCPLCGINGKF